MAFACARHFQEFNSAVFSREIGVTLPTVKSWAGVLEASYLVYMLPPLFLNLGKRVIKTHKLYLMDPAIACYLTRQPGMDAALAGAMVRDWWLLKLPNVSPMQASSRRSGSGDPMMG